LVALEQGFGLCQQRTQLLLPHVPCK
jgi:hypothetical protein